MKLSNRHGTAVDPVPFVVASLLGMLVSFSYGPGYLMALGFSLTGGLLGALSASTALAALAYHRYVWTYYPELAAEVPVEHRLRRLFYGVLVGVGVLALLALPLLAQ